MLGHGVEVPLVGNPIEPVRAPILEGQSGPGYEVPHGRGLGPDLVVLGVSGGDRVRAYADAIRKLAALVPVALGGEVTTAEAAEIGATVIEGNPTEAARWIVAPVDQG